MFSGRKQIIQRQLPDAGSPNLVSMSWARISPADAVRIDRLAWYFPGLTGRRQRVSLVERCGLFLDNRKGGATVKPEVAAHCCVS